MQVVDAQASEMEDIVLSELGIHWQMRDGDHERFLEPTGAEVCSDNEPRSVRCRTDDRVSVFQNRRRR